MTHRCTIAIVVIIENPVLLIKLTLHIQKKFFNKLKNKEF